MQVSFQSIKNEIQNRWADYAQTAAAVAAVATVVRVVWGKHAAIGFVIVSVGAFPFVKNYLFKVMNYDITAAEIAGRLIFASTLCFFFPIAASLSMITLSAAILKRESKSAEIANNNRMQNEKLVNANRTLDESNEKIKVEVRKLRSAFVTCLGLLEKVKMVKKIELDINAIIDEQEAPALAQMRENLNKINAFYQLIATDRELLNRIAIAKQVAADLNTLTTAYTEKQTQLEHVSRELSQSREKLDVVTISLIGLEQKEIEQLQRLKASVQRFK